MALTTVDVSALSDPHQGGYAASIAAIHHSGRTSGAFAIEGHGLPAALLERTFAVAARFFALPSEVKMRYAASKSATRGYHPFPNGVGDIREKFLVTSELDPGGRAPSLAGENRWPVEVAGFVETVTEYLRALEGLGRLVLRGVSASLRLPETELESHFNPSGGVALWLLHYPAVPVVDGKHGQGTSTHSDLHPLALIAQDEIGGLECHGPEGWASVDPRAQPMVCQMGDLTARWSNDLYVANVHRVWNDPVRSRYSLAVFLQPSLDAFIAPVPTCVGPDRPPRYLPATYRECFTDWLRALDDGTLSAPHRR